MLVKAFTGSRASCGVMHSVESYGLPGFPSTSLVSLLSHWPGSISNAEQSPGIAKRPAEATSGNKTVRTPGIVVAPFTS
jgi:hypothetical protein